MENTIELLQKIGNKILNQANIHDLVALNFEAQGFSKLGDKYKSHALEERDFSQKLFNHILDLGGKICYQNQVSFEVPASPLEWLRHDLEVSKEGLKELLPLVGAASNDLVTYDWLKDYYKDEDDDLQWTQQQLNLIDAIGYQNWLTQQL